MKWTCNSAGNARSSPAPVRASGSRSRSRRLLPRKDASSSMIAMTCPAGMLVLSGQLARIAFALGRQNSACCDGRSYPGLHGGCPEEAKGCSGDQMTLDVEDFVTGSVRGNEALGVALGIAASGRSPLAHPDNVPRRLRYPGNVRSRRSRPHRRARNCTKPKLSSSEGRYSSVSYTLSHSEGRYSAPSTPRLWNVQALPSGIRIFLKRDKNASSVICNSRFARRMPRR